MSGNQTREGIIQTAAALRYELGGQLHDSTVEALYAEAGAIAGRSVIEHGRPRRPNFQRRLDMLLTSRLTGFPMMFLLLAVVFWLTITGANIPSQFLSSLLLDTLHPVLSNAGKAIDGFLSVVPGAEKKSCQESTEYPQGR